MFLSPHKKRNRKVRRRGINVPPSPPPQKKKRKEITSQPAAIHFFLLDSGSAGKVQFLHKHLLSLFLCGSV